MFGMAINACAACTDQFDPTERCRDAGTLCTVLYAQHYNMPFIAEAFAGLCLAYARYSDSALYLRCLTINGDDTSWMGGTQSKQNNFIDQESFDVGDVVLFTGASAAAECVRA